MKKKVSPSKEVDNFSAFHIAKQKLAPTKKNKLESDTSKDVNGCEGTTKKTGWRESERRVKICKKNLGEN